MMFVIVVLVMLYASFYGVSCVIYLLQEGSLLDQIIGLPLCAVLLGGVVKLAWNMLRDAFDF
jgi:hypothetical protein